MKPHLTTTKGMIDLRRQRASDSELRAALRDGSLIRLRPEVAVDAEHYRSSPRWTRNALDATALGLTLDRAALCGNSAAVFWGIPVLDLRFAHEITYGKRHPPSTTHRRGRNLIVRQAHLEDHEVVVVKGVRLTTVGRTLRDIARYHGAIAGVVAMDFVLNDPSWSRRRLNEAVLTSARYPNKSIVHRAVDLAREGAGSPAESRLRAIIVESGLVAPEEIELQSKVMTAMGPRYLDLRLQGVLGVEYDGDDKYHGAYGIPTARAIHDELRREKDIRNTGVPLVRICKEHLAARSDGSYPAIDVIRDALGRLPGNRAA